MGILLLCLKFSSPARNVLFLYFYSAIVKNFGYTNNQMVLYSILAKDLSAFVNALVTSSSSVLVNEESL